LCRMCPCHRRRSRALRNSSGMQVRLITRSVMATLKANCMTSPRLLITLCTYNELDNLSRLIPEIHAVVPDADVIVIDDNSPDGTGRLADEMGGKAPRIKGLPRG